MSVPARKGNLQQRFLEEPSIFDSQSKPLKQTLSKQIPGAKPVRVCGLDLHLRVERLWGPRQPPSPLLRFQSILWCFLHCLPSHLTGAIWEISSRIWISQILILSKPVLLPTGQEGWISHTLSAFVYQVLGWLTLLTCESKLCTTAKKTTSYWDRLWPNTLNALHLYLLMAQK